MVQLRWGFPPARPKGAPVINFRSEGRRFPKGRCLIPASHFFEFTGTKSPKSKWKFTKGGEDWFCFTGLWRPMPDGAGEAFTLLTTEPGPDVAPIHDRQMVVLDRPDWLAWLDLTRPESQIQPVASHAGIQFWANEAFCVNPVVCSTAIALTAIAFFSSAKKSCASSSASSQPLTMSGR